jgi:hypothetical protein
LRVIIFINVRFDNFQISFLSHDYVSNTYRDRFRLSFLRVLWMKWQNEDNWSFLIFLLAKKLNFSNLLDLFFRRQKTFVFIWLNVYVQIFNRSEITLWWCLYYLRILCFRRCCRFWNLFNFRQRRRFRLDVVLTSNHWWNH